MKGNSSKFIRRAISLAAASLVVSALSYGCSAPSWYNMGDLNEPQGVATAVPRQGKEPLPHLFMYISDTTDNALMLVDVTLRVYEEAPAPYFPLRIPVGDRPTRISVATDQQRLYVINSTDHTVSVVDTNYNVETGAEKWNGSGFSHVDPVTGLPLRIILGTGSMVAVDLAAVTSAAAGATRLYVAVDNSDFTGTLMVYDTSLVLPDGTPNQNAHTRIAAFSLPGTPGRIDVSPDGDSVYVSNKLGPLVSKVNVPAGTVATLNLGMTTDTVRYAPVGPNGTLYFASKYGDGTFMVDAGSFTQVLTRLSPTVVMPAMLPIKFAVPAALAMSPQTQLGCYGYPYDILSTETPGCPGYIGMMPLTNGSITALDVGGCMFIEDLTDTNRVKKFTAGNFSGLLVEDLDMDQVTGAMNVISTVTPPTLTVNGQSVSPGSGGNPTIVNWASGATSNYGIRATTVLRQYFNESWLMIIFEGLIAIGDGAFAADGVTFDDPEADFIYAGAAPGDFLLLMNADGSEITQCDDGTPLDVSQFLVTAVTTGTITVSGGTPKPGCFAAPVPYQVRPLNQWTVGISGYGLIGRAVEGQQFWYPSDAIPAGMPPHLTFTLATGTSPSVRNSAFQAQFIFYPFGILPSGDTEMFMPTDMVVAPDTVNVDFLWGLVAYPGSAGVYQFNPRTLDSTYSKIYN